MRGAFILAAAGILGLSFFAPHFAQADNWQASIYEDSAPGRLVGVDKKRHTFNFYEKKQPVNLRYTYPCVTGQLAGDKQQVNDRRTPEGVYFVEYKIANGLDFREYGGIAYTLNYPNPVDKLRGKTGYGIWIHSKGFDLVPTKGCVAINLKNIEEIGPRLLPGTPVVVAEELQSISGADNNELSELKNLMEEWSKAWESRSPKYFDFYDPEAYTRATENFASFRKNKERLFGILSFINIYNREIHALAGPGYWVTWSEQLYKASNLSTEGVRRLYWQKDKAGKFRIVGMEWTPRNLGLQAEFSKGKLVAQAPATTVSDASSEAPVLPRLDMPENAPIEDKPLAAPHPVKDREGDDGPQWFGKMGGDLGASISAFAKNLLAVSEPLVPKRMPRLQSPPEINWGQGKPLTGKPRPDAPEEKSPEKAISAPAPDSGTALEEKPVQNVPEPVNDGKNLKDAEKAQPEVAQKEAAPKKMEPLVLDDKTRKELEAAVSAWMGALERQDIEILNLYDQKKYNRLIKEGVPKGLTLARVKQGLQDDLKQPWLKVLNRAPQLEVIGNFARSRSDLMLATPTGIRQGVQTLWWQPEGDGKFSIVSSEFVPRALGLDANYLEKVSNEVTAELESWRKAWESADLDDYLAHYAQDANQQGRLGKAHIRRQKETLWKNVKPVQVQFSGLRIALDKNGIRADMNQNYSDSAGKSDRGLKTLFLRYDGSKWRIHREDWVNLQQVSR